jgi:anti-sigma B factor antagonist
MSVDFSVAVDYTEAWIPIVHVIGEVDMATAPELRRALVAASAGRPPAIVVDLTAVGFLDSSGIGVLAGAYRQLQAHGGQLHVATSSPLIVRLFEITHTDRAFRVVPTLAEAVGSTFVLAATNGRSHDGPAEGPEVFAAGK